MAVILVTGMSGTGKSAALAELARRGHRVVDTDHGDWIEDVQVSDGSVEPLWNEERIDALPGVEESAVIGLPDPDFGEAVIAFVVARSGHTLSEAGIIATLKDEIARFKVPKRVVFTPELPRNAMGKVQKSALRERMTPR